MKIENNVLTPDKGKHLKNVDQNWVAEYQVFLGKNDKPANYSEITEEEYQQFLIEKEKESTAKAVEPLE